MAAKKPNTTNINTKEAGPNRKIGLRLNSLFFNCENNPPLVATNTFDFVSILPSLILLMIVRNSILSFMSITSFDWGERDNYHYVTGIMEVHKKNITFSLLFTQEPDWWPVWPAPPTQPASLY